MTFFILTFLSLFYKPIKNLLTERKSTWRKLTPQI
jgi:hypothetical protein